MCFITYYILYDNYIHTPAAPEPTAGSAPLTEPTAGSAPEPTAGSAPEHTAAFWGACGSTTQAARQPLSRQPARPTARAREPSAERQPLPAAAIIIVITIIIIILQ
jgi:ferric-dicitrate binding protein FerR (iron transport regulator)